MRTPDETSEVKLGKLKVTVRQWIDPTDLPWHGDEELPKNAEGYDAYVEAEIVVDGQRFESRSSLGSIWIEPNREGREYVRTCVKEITDEAIHDLQEEIAKIANGAALKDAKVRTGVAKSIVTRLPRRLTKR